MKTLGVIPARYASTRFPGKPLVDINGKSMIRRVYEQAVKSQRLDEITVATDDRRIFEHVSGFGGKVMMTSGHHKTGTDRCAEVLSKIQQDFEYTVNIQGDEPFIRPEQIDQLVNFIQDYPQMGIATLGRAIKDASSIFDPNQIKVIIAKNGRALYFSRSPIPHLRDEDRGNWVSSHTYYKHIGMYAFKSPVLTEVSMLDPTPLETAESLEQLRWMENGFAIGVCLTEYQSPSIDTEADLRNVLKMFGRP